MRKGIITLHLLAIVSLLASQGCDQTKSAFSTEKTFFKGNPDAVVAAVTAAAEELELKSISHSATKLDGEVVAYTARDKKVHVKVYREGDDVSSMKVKVGPLGDSDMEGAIIQATRKRLE